MVRIHIGPEKLDKIVEYAPSVEGAAPAFKHSLDNLENLLEACEASFRSGYLNTLAYFEDKEFKKRFPNAKTIGNEQWRHAYLAMLVSICLTSIYDKCFIKIMFIKIIFIIT